MSEDKEKRVVESTRRDHSDIHSLTGNLLKMERKNVRKINNEGGVKNPVTAVLIVLASFAIIFIAAFVIIKLIEVLSR